MSDDADDLVADIQAAAAESLAVLTDSRPCALYRIFTADDRLLYVGISTGPAARIKQHENDKPWWIEARRITIEPFDTTEEAAQAERHAIATEKPVHNISGGGRRMSDEDLKRRRAERAADAEARLREFDETYTPPDTSCTNCGWAAVRLPKGTLIADALCHRCGCQTLQRSANGP